MQAVIQPTEAVAPAQAGASHPDRRDPHARRRERVRVREARVGGRAAAVRPRGRRRPGPRRRPGHGRPSDRTLLARVRAGRPGGPGLRLPGPRPVGARARAPVRRRPDPAGPVRSGRRRAGGLPAIGRQPGRARPGRRGRAGDEERRRGPRGVRLGGRPAAGPAVRRDRDLRGARPRLHRPSEQRRGSRAPRAPTPGSSRRSRTSSTSASRRSSCCRCTSSTPRTRPAAGPTTGATSRCRSSPRTPPTAAGPAPRAPWTSSATSSRRSTGRAWRSSSTSSTTTRPRAATAGRRSPIAASPTTSTTSSIPADRSRYADYSGCGNTLNANEPVVRRLILDSLRSWVSDMHVDGFRFDLASVLSRDEDGNPVPRPPIIWDIETDPVLAGTKLIAEAWDAAGPVPGRVVRRRPLDGVERPLPRRRPRVRQERPGQGVGGRPAAPGLAGHLRPPRARAAEDDQLRHLPRRVHAQRRRLLRPQAQRGQRRGQPGRQRRQRQLERRRRGADGRPGDRGAPRAPGQEPAGAGAARRRACRC